MNDECMYKACTNTAVSRVFTERVDTPFRVCFVHERELVDRYGVADVQPQGLYAWTRDVHAAVAFLQEGV
jgi:hypothetical protein